MKPAGRSPGPDPRAGRIALALFLGWLASWIIVGPLTQIHFAGLPLFWWVQLLYITTGLIFGWRYADRTGSVAIGRPGEES